MNNLVSFLLIIPIILWCIFQPVLFVNAMLIEQGLNNVIYETQKEASLQGRYDEDIYREMKDRLVEVHKFDPNEIIIQGTESLTMRGERMMIEITIPKPKTNVFELFGGEEELYHFQKYVMSEYAN